MKRTILSIAIFSILVSPSYAGMAVIYKDQSIFSYSSSDNEVHGTEKNENFGDITEETFTAEITEKSPVDNNSHYYEIKKNSLDTFTDSKHHQTSEINRAVREAQLGVETYSQKKSSELRQQSSAREFIVTTDKFGNVISTEIYLRSEQKNAEFFESAPNPPKKVLKMPLSESLSTETKVKVRPDEEMAVSSHLRATEADGGGDVPSKYFKVSKNSEFNINTVQGGVKTSSNLTQRKVVFRTVSKEEIKKYTQDQATKRSLRSNSKDYSATVQIHAPKKRHKKVKNKNRKVLSPALLLNNNVEKKINHENLQLNGSEGKPSNTLTRVNQAAIVNASPKLRMVIDPNTLKPTFVTEDVATSVVVKVPSPKKVSFNK